MTGGMGIGAAASVVGGIMQSIAANKAGKNMKRAFARELNRQNGFSNEAMDVFNPAVQNLGAEHARELMQSGQQGRELDYKSINSVPLMAGYTAPMKDRMKLALLGKLRSKIGSYGDWQHQQGMDQLHTQQRISRVADTAKGSAALMPYRMHDAQHSMDELAFWGQLVSSIGGSAMNAQSLFSPPPQQQGRTEFYGNPGFSYTAPSGTSLSFVDKEMDMF